jgi:hypothetical protein
MTLYTNIVDAKLGLHALLPLVDKIPVHQDLQVRCE